MSTQIEQAKQAVVTENIRPIERLEAIVKFGDDNRPTDGLDKISNAESIVLGYGLRLEGEKLQDRGSFVVAGKAMTLKADAKEAYLAQVRAYIKGQEYSGKNKLTNEQADKKASNFLSEVKAATYCLLNPSVKSAVHTVAQALPKLKGETEKEMKKLLVSGASQSVVKAKVKEINAKVATPPARNSGSGGETPTVDARSPQEKAIDAIRASVSTATSVQWDAALKAGCSPAEIRVALAEKYVELGKLMMSGQTLLWIRDPKEGVKFTNVK